MSINQADVKREVALKSKIQALTYLEASNFGRAFAHFLVVLKLAPELKNELKLLFSSTLCTWGKQLESQQRYDDLFNCYEQALEIFPENEVVLCNLGAHLFRAGHLREAAHYFRRSLEADSDHLPAFAHLQAVSGRLVERWHFRMLNDSHRNEAYREAVMKKVRQGFDRVLDIGTGTGLLSLYAVEAGAKEVYACDYSPTMCAIAKDVLAANKASNDVKLINKLSNNIEIPGDLPHRVSLVVTETMDCGLLGEHLLSTMLDAWDRLAQKPSAQLCATLRDDAPPPHCGAAVPFGARLWAVPVRRKAARRHYARAASPWRIDACAVLASEPYDAENLRDVECEFLCDPVKVFSFDFNDPAGLREFYEAKRGKSVSFEYEGTADAVAAWFDIILDEDIEITSSPLVDNPECCWDQAVFNFDRPTESVQLRANCAGGKLEFKAVPDNRESLFLPEKQTAMTVSAEAISFMNNTELQNALYSLTECCANVKNVLDLSPFPLLGLGFVRSNGASLTCVLKTEEEKFSLKRFAEDNNLDWNGVKCLNEADLSDFSAGSEKFDIILANFFESTGELKTEMIENIPLLMSLLSPGGILAPSRVTVVFQLMDCDWAIRTSSVTNEELIQNYRIAEFLNVYKVSQQLDVNLRNIKYTSLSEEILCLCLPVEELACDSCRNVQITVPVLRDGSLSSIAVWYKYQLSVESETLSTKSENSHVNQNLFVVDSPKGVKKGGTVIVNVSYYLGILRLKIQI